MDTRNIQELRSQLKQRIGERVQKARERSGFSSQESLAAAIGLSRQAISAIESGRSVPASDTLFLISQETRQPLEFFFSASPPSFLAGSQAEQKLDRALAMLEELLRSSGKYPGES
ncbi:MAG: helix-turn-helix transcriptional regulator [Candidatus Eremiobacteraeota bacterium]|nr:helix-turn-helix transcriptional regulator [Candidatus Eremiobacteraeota bacterium]MCW5868918.1 helix-turn-helix transcriptional regulator [Candidatus Eremiobacteraeota bacterium]